MSTRNRLRMLCATLLLVACATQAPSPSATPGIPACAADQRAAAQAPAGWHQAIDCPRESNRSLRMDHNDTKAQGHEVSGLSCYRRIVACVDSLSF